VASFGPILKLGSWLATKGLSQADVDRVLMGISHEEVKLVVRRKASFQLGVDCERIGLARRSENPHRMTICVLLVIIGLSTFQVPKFPFFQVQPSITIHKGPSLCSPYVMSRTGGFHISVSNTQDSGA
jgi:hypothetical protein